jgi:hypothetical protein
MEEMNMMKKAAGLTLALLFVWAGIWGQDKPVDTKKLYNEIAGTYDCEFNGQVMVVIFFEKDGKLFGAPENETPEEILPVKDKPLFFEVTPAGSGELYELEFKRNEQKVIDSCVIKVQGMEILGKKRK